MLMRFGADQKLEWIPLDDVSFSKKAIQGAVGEEEKDRRGNSLRSWAVSHMHFADGNLMITGLSNKEFKSTFRKMAFPFKDDTLPANNLKFWLQFGLPLSEKSPYPFIHLIDEAGDTLQNAILELDPPLMGDDHASLTIWLDPGRIKRELNLNQKYGLPLRPGKSFELGVSREISSQSGSTLEEDFSKHFFVTEADRSIPSPKLVLPRTHSCEPLVVDFGEAMDYGSTAGNIFLYKNEAVQEVDFEGEGDYRLWKYSPKNDWQPGEYEVRIDVRVEDLAGNTLLRPFDRDLKATPPEGGVNKLSITNNKLIIPFRLE